MNPDNPNFRSAEAWEDRYNRIKAERDKFQLLSGKLATRAAEFESDLTHHKEMLEKKDAEIDHLKHYVINGHEIMHAELKSKLEKHEQIIKNMSHCAYQLGQMITCTCSGPPPLELCDSCKLVLDVDILMDESGVNNE